MGKYYDWSRKIVFSETDGCSFAEWMKNADNHFSYGVHPDGFLVFLRPSEIHKFDEYSAGDPYTVGSNLDTLFHKQRVKGTIDLLNFALDRESATPKILDVACGEGHITVAIHQTYPTAEILAFDGSLSAVRNAHQAYKGITFAVANAYDPPYAPDYFDCVVCNNIWEHVPDPLRLLNSIARSLKPNGYLIISTPSRYHLNNLLRVLVGKPVALVSPHHVTEYSVGQVLEQLRYAGFLVEKIAGKLLWPEKLTLRSLIKCGMGCLIAGFLRLNGSHHNLGSTVFYLAKKRG